MLGLAFVASERKRPRTLLVRGWFIFVASMGLSVLTRATGETTAGPSEPWLFAQVVLMAIGGLGALVTLLGGYLLLSSRDTLGEGGDADGVRTAVLVAVIIGGFLGLIGGGFGGETGLGLVWGMVLLGLGGPLLLWPFLLLFVLWRLTAGGLWEPERRALRRAVGAVLLGWVLGLPAGVLGGTAAVAVQIGSLVVATGIPAVLLSWVIVRLGRDQPVRFKPAERRVG